jgi:Histidine kinase
MSTAPKHIDWSQLWYPGPKRAFSDEEMARAGSEPPSPTLVLVVAANLALLAFAFLMLAPREQTARLLGLVVLLVVSGVAAARWLWRRPWRRALMQATLAYTGMMVLLAVLLRWRLPEPREERYWIALLLACGGVLVQFLLWFMVVWRAQQIEARLAEQAERASAIEMARRLASAQLEPHFLFNTLASVQHWVQTKDDRAAPLLAALTGYLRATLPLFNRPLLALHEELTAVQQYLQVMQLRMGPRLAWRVDVQPALHTLALPPGLLLTLVENAVVHGLEPQIAGGTLTLSARTQARQALIEVSDSGAGPPSPLHEGLGLGNVRQRLALAFGDKATLTLAAAPAGGFIARIQLPITPSP